MTENIRIRSLAERPELAPVLAEWFRKEWPDTFRTWPVERVVAEYFTPASDDEGLPLVLVAEIPEGVAQLVGERIGGTERVEAEGRRVALGNVGPTSR